MANANRSLGVLALVAFAVACSGASNPACAAADPAGAVETGQGASVPSEGPPTDTEGEATVVHEVATFLVHDLDDSTMREFMKALADVSGVVVAQADMKAGLVNVTYAPAACSADDIRTALATVRPEVMLRGVRPGTRGDFPAGHDCKNCPIRGSCPKKR